MTFVLVLIGSVVSLLYWRVFRFTRQLRRRQSKMARDTDGRGQQGFGHF